MDYIGFNPEWIKSERVENIGESNIEREYSYKLVVVGPLVTHSTFVFAHIARYRKLASCVC